MTLDPGFETELSRALERLFNASGGPTPENLAESIRYSLLAPGKRIRPRLALATGELVGIARPASMAGAVALEMIHCFTLIHDDLPCMDDDDFRRGRPSNHKKHGEAIALLAGDGLLAMAFEALLDAESHVSAPALIAATRRLAWASGPRGVAGGQAAEALLAKTSTLSALQDMHARKTGALFAASILIPMDLAGLREPDPKAHALSSFSRELGLAFQVADDLDDALTPGSNEASGEARSPLNILHYLSAEEARARSTRSLASACASLKTAWGSRPELDALILIADSVQASLSHPGGRS